MDRRRWVVATHLSFSASPSLVNRAEFWKNSWSESSSFSGPPCTISDKHESFQKIINILFWYSCLPLSFLKIKTKILGTDPELCVIFKGFFWKNHLFNFNVSLGPFHCAKFLKKSLQSRCRVGSSLICYLRFRKSHSFMSY